MISLILFGLCFVCLCLFVVLRFTHWSRQNVPFVPLKYPFIYGNITKGKHPALQFADFYESNRIGNYPMIGIYIMFVKPALLIVEPSLIRQVLNSDFKHFQNRGMFSNKKDDVLSAILGTLDYNAWKPIRAKLTRAFTPLKIREKFSIMKNVGEELVQGLNLVLATENELEIRGLFGRYAADVIGFIALGLQFECVNNPRTELQEMIQKAMQSHSKFPWNILKNACPKFAQFFRMRKHPKDITDFFVGITEQTIRYRTETNERRDDYMQVLIDAGLSTDEIAALTFDFLSAGYADVTSTLSYCLYEISLPENQHIQEQARREIESVLGHHEKGFSHEALDEMDYCKAIVNGKLIHQIQQRFEKISTSHLRISVIFITETFRKHPVGGNLTRIATKAFKVPGTEYTIPEGMRIYIPTYAIHHDETIYSEPEKFDPHRFTQGNKAPANAFLPFGDGKFTILILFPSFCHTL